ncbi:MAG: hypothetical protein JWP88_401, partial [Flaviaesturariibacter sp.]|nr:hypothetical protein [Flaviaesturariibacter sp.]
MKLFSAEQIRRWDAYTIAKEGISSFDLMQRAAGTCTDWIAAQGYAEQPFTIFCGKGNNGGDGLVIAKNLLQQGYFVEVYILEFGKLGTPDFQEALG